MSLRALILAWRDLLHPRILSVVLAGTGLTLALLVAVQALVFWAIRWFSPETVTLPWLGQVPLGSYLSWGSILLLPVMAVFLMAPVAAAFSGLFAERVAVAVEETHYPDQRGQPLDFWDGLLESLAVTGAVVLVGLGTMLLTPFLGPLAPLVWFTANGWLLGREFFQMAARRHLPRERAAEMHRALNLRVTALGVMIAVLLVVPVLNIAVPVLAAAGFTHLFQLSRTSFPDRRG